MPEENFEEKTEKATPRKKEDFRKKGEVAKSRELPSVAVLLAGMVTIVLFASYMNSQIQTIIREDFALIPVKEFSLTDFMIFARRMVFLFLLTIGPLFGSIFLAAILSNVMQIGFMLSTEAIKPKLSKLNPIKGFGRLVSKQAFMELFKTLLKLVTVGGVAYLMVKSEMKGVYGLWEMEINSIVAYTLIMIFKISIGCTLAMILLVIIDYSFQKWDFEKRLRMSKQELKDEMKRLEGDPLIKSRIRSIQMQMARKRMMQDVPKADVVITNPTRLAVALKYDPSAMSAPKILAKGARKIAERIKELAAKHSIPIVENKELAQSLYALVDIGDEVPPNLYQAVAEVLAYIYKMKGNKKAFAG
jgi:flagellar biosynthesis protein FlhB